MFSRNVPHGPHGVIGPHAAAVAVAEKPPGIECATTVRLVRSVAMVRTVTRQTAAHR